MISALCLALGAGVGLVLAWAVVESLPPVGAR